MVISLTVNRERLSSGEQTAELPADFGAAKGQSAMLSTAFPAASSPAHSAKARQPENVQELSGAHLRTAGMRGRTRAALSVYQRSPAQCVRQWRVTVNAKNRGKNDGIP